MTDDFGRYLKQEIESSADERFKRVLWHPEDSSKLILATACECRFPPISDISNLSCQPNYPNGLTNGRRGCQLPRFQGIQEQFWLWMGVSKCYPGHLSNPLTCCSYSRSQRAFDAFPLPKRPSSNVVVQARSPVRPGTCARLFLFDK